MNLIDRRPAQLSDINNQLENAPNIMEHLRLMFEKEQLEGALRPSFDALSRLQRGWVFVPPSVHPALVE